MKDLIWREFEKALWEMGEGWQGRAGSWRKGRGGESTCLDGHFIQVTSKRVHRHQQPLTLAGRVPPAGPLGDLGGPIGALRDPVHEEAAAGAPEVTNLGPGGGWGLGYF